MTGKEIVAHNTEVLPSYEHPPVNEVVYGLYFHPLENLLVPHFGRYWSTIEDDYPQCSEAAPLVTPVETFGEAGIPSLELSDTPPLPRIWFTHKNANTVIQVQRDAFLFNWRKVKPEDKYPRYGELSKEFHRQLSLFDQFVQSRKIGAVRPFQHELTYVNQIPQGEGWETMADVRQLFPDFSWRDASGRFLPSAELANWRSIFSLPEKAGRLHVSIRNARRKSDGKPVIVLELTARGFKGATSLSDIHAWYETAREWIVRGFTDLTSEEVQSEIWKRTQ